MPRKKSLDEVKSAFRATRILNADLINKKIRVLPP
jgi:hypothetical protein